MTCVGGDPAVSAPHSSVLGRKPTFRGRRGPRAGRGLSTSCVQRSPGPCPRALPGARYRSVLCGGASDARPSASCPASDDAHRGSVSRPSLRSHVAGLRPRRNSSRAGILGGQVIPCVGDPPAGAAGEECHLGRRRTFRGPRAPRAGRGLCTSCMWRGPAPCPQVPPRRHVEAQSVHWSTLCRICTA